MELNDIYHVNDVLGSFKFNKNHSGGKKKKGRCRMLQSRILVLGRRWEGVEILTFRSYLSILLTTESLHDDQELV